MDQEEIKNLIMERFQNLQPEIQNIILDENYDSKLIEIAKKFNLSNDQLLDLEINTTLVLMGDTHPDEYKERVMADLKLDESVIDQIVNDVNNTILKNVLNTIKQNFIEDDLAEKNSQKEQIINSNPEIPLPPYKEELDMKEKGEEEKNDIIPPVNKEEIPIKNEQDIYKSTSTQIIGNKLFNSTISTQTTSDHSLPKISPKKDPYKEEI